MARREPRQERAPIDIVTQAEPDAVWLAGQGASHTGRRHRRKGEDKSAIYIEYRRDTNC